MCKVDLRKVRRGKETAGERSGKARGGKRLCTAPSCPALKSGRLACHSSVPFAGSQDGCWEFLPVQLAGYLLAPSLNNGWVSILLFVVVSFHSG